MLVYRCVCSLSLYLVCDQLLRETASSWYLRFGGFGASNSLNYTEFYFERLARDESRQPSSDMSDLPRMPFLLIRNSAAIHVPQARHSFSCRDHTVARSCFQSFVMDDWLDHRL